MSALRTDLPASEALRRLARKTLAALARDLTSASLGNGVHTARKRLKFMRSLLRLMRFALGEADFRAANGQLRSAAHHLAAARRREAMRECITKLSRHETLNPAAAAELAAAAAAHSGHSAAHDALPDAATAARLDIDSVRAAIAGWRLPRHDPRSVVKGLRKTYARARKRLAEGLETGETPLLHEARKAVIHTLHHHQILAPLWPEAMTVWSAGLTVLREALGDLNDLDELASQLHGAGSPFAAIAAQDEVRAAIASRRKDLLKKAARRSTHLFAEKPGAFARRIDTMWRGLG